MITDFSALDCILGWFRKIVGTVIKKSDKNLIFYVANYLLKAPLANNLLPWVTDMEDIPAFIQAWRTFDDGGDDAEGDEDEVVFVGYMSLRLAVNTNRT